MGTMWWDSSTLVGMHLGSCILEEPLSLGGMGAVFLARQERPRRYVAVKIIHRHQALDPAAWSLFLARFQREADATASLDHANIVPIYEFGETGDIAYLVMPHLPDGSLAARLEREGPLPLPLVLTAVEQVAAALDYAHARGIVHRDVKPSNMLLHPDGRILLSDFGIARPIYVPAGDFGVDLGASISWAGGRLTETGIAMGTPEYMAPEQIRREAITPATDTYGLAIATYELLGGRTPFLDNSVPTMLFHQLTSPPPSLRALRSDLPVAVEEVIFRALAKDPEHRPTSSGSFARELRAAAQDEESHTAIGPTRLNAPKFLSQDDAAFTPDVGTEADRPPQSLDRTLPMPGGPPTPIPMPPDFAGDVRGFSNDSLSGLVQQEAGIALDVSERTQPISAPIWTSIQQTGSRRRLGNTTIVGLALGGVGLLVVAALLISGLHAVFTGTSAATHTPGIVYASSTPGSTSASATHTPQSRPTVTSSVSMSTSVVPPPPTGSVASPTSTSAPPANWLVVSLSQIAFACPQTPNQSVQLTNVGPNSSHGRDKSIPPRAPSSSPSHHPPARSPPVPA